MPNSAAADTSGFVDVGLRLHIRRWPGNKTPFLLVHGLASNSRTWELVADLLCAAGHPVVAVDQRGHGLSDKPDSGYTFDAVTEDLQRLLAALGWEKAYVAGQSWGGNVVLSFAARYPSLVAGLALVDGGYIDFQLDPQNTWERVAVNLRPPNLLGTLRSALYGRIAAHNPEWTIRGINASLANFETLADGTIRPWLTLDRHMQILRALWEQRPAEIFPNVSAPVLICAAEGGRSAEWQAIKQQQIRAAEVGLSRSEVHWFRATAHDIHIHRPEALSSLFLSAIARGFW